MAHANGKVVEMQPRDSSLSIERLETISHDFRTPLNIIIGFAELLLDEVPGKINDEQRRSLNDILDSGRRLLSLLNDILEPPLT
jgi:signal transduction histidine kinase